MPNRCKKGPPQRARLHRRADRFLLLGVDLRTAALDVGLAVHPFVEARALEAPAIAQLEGGHKPLRRVFVECIGRDAQILGGLPNVHDFAHFRDKKVRSRRVPHYLPPNWKMISESDLRRMPVSLVITRFYRELQGISGDFLLFPRRVFDDCKRPKTRSARRRSMLWRRPITPPYLGLVLRKMLSLRWDSQGDLTHL